MRIMIKTSMKLLLRTKAFWFFLILTPILSTLVLRSEFDSSAAYIHKDNGEIIELTGSDDKVAYNGGNGEYLVKVYDASGSEASEEILKNLAGSGMYMICRADLSGQGEVFTDAFVERHMERDGFEDRMGAALYIYPGFDSVTSADEMSAYFRIYALSDDARTELLESDAEFLLGGYVGSGMDFLNAVNAAGNNKNVISVSADSFSELTVKQVNQKTQIGYAFAFMTLGFVFCGIFVAHTSIKEQKNGVYIRISLSGTGPLRYFASKFVTAVIISMMATGVMGICSLFMSSDDLGMSRLRFLAMIFLLGLIFCLVSMLLGILMGDVMSANVAAFMVWCMSALFSGLYFPIKDVSDLIRLISSLMPQKWFMDAAEMMIRGTDSALGMLLCITGAYTMVVISAGGLGLKLRRKSEWGNS